MLTHLKEIQVEYERALHFLLRGHEVSFQVKEIRHLLHSLNGLSRTAQCREIWAPAVRFAQALEARSEQMTQDDLQLLHDLERMLEFWVDEGEARFDDDFIGDLSARLAAYADSAGVAGGIGVHLDSPAATHTPIVTARLLQNSAYREADATRASAALQSSLPTQRSTVIGESSPGAAPEAGLSPASARQFSKAMHTLSEHPAWGQGGNEFGARGASGRLELRDAVPFRNATARLSRVVKQACGDLAKDAELSVDGDVILERELLKKLLPELERVLRNTVYYGVEPPAERLRKNKPQTGSIAIRLQRASDEIKIIFETDGLSVDFERTMAKARELNLLSSSAEPSDSQLVALLLHPGFTTAQHATRVAGYGIGLDAAQVGIADVGGTLDVTRAANGGLRLILRLPIG